MEPSSTDPIVVNDVLDRLQILIDDDRYFWAFNDLCGLYEEIKCDARVTGNQLTRIDNIEDVGRDRWIERKARRR